jgi:hypothetical protein
MSRDYEIHNKKWFIDRIGKRVYRTESSCKCQTCVDVFINGLVISDEMHADYLYCCQNELNLFYFDEKQKEAK